MATEPARLSGQVQRELAALRRAVTPHGKPVEVQLAKGAPSFGEDEVLVVVVGRHGAFASSLKKSGHDFKPRELRLRLAAAEAAVDGITAANSARQSPPPLTTAEAAMLDDADFGAAIAEVPTALERTKIDFEMLLQSSLTLEDAAKILHVSTGRLRQRLGADRRTLYGWKEGRAWRVPRFQFDRKGRLVRGIEKVIPRIRHDAPHWS